jgi:hypothetical protein
MEEDKSDVSAPWHMWGLGVLLLLWHAMAAIDYVMTVIRYEPYLSRLPADALAYYTAAPLWMYVMWGVSMIGGLVATVLLLMRRAIAVPVFALAWAASVVAVGYTLVNPVPGGGNALFAGLILLISLSILAYFYWLQKRGVLR